MNERTIRREMINEYNIFNEWLKYVKSKTQRIKQTTKSRGEFLIECQKVWNITFPKQFLKIYYDSQ